MRQRHRRYVHKRAHIGFFVVQYFIACHRDFSQFHDAVTIKISPDVGFCHPDRLGRVVHGDLVAEIRVFVVIAQALDALQVRRLGLVVAAKVIDVLVAHRFKFGNCALHSVGAETGGFNVLGVAAN